MKHFIIALPLIVASAFVFSACSSQSPLGDNQVFNSPTPVADSSATTSVITPEPTAALIPSNISDQDLLKLVESDGDTTVDASLDQIEKELNSN